MTIKGSYTRYTILKYLPVFRIAPVTARPRNSQIPLLQRINTCDLNIRNVINNFKYHV